MTSPWSPCSGAAGGGAGPPVGGAGVPVRQVRGVRQRHHHHDEPPHGRLERGPVQGHHHQGTALRRTRESNALGTRESNALRYDLVYFIILTLTLTLNLIVSNLSRIATLLWF